MAHSRRVGKNWVITGLWIEKKGNNSLKEKGPKVELRRHD